MRTFDMGSRLGMVVVLAGTMMLAGCASGGASLARHSDGHGRTDAKYVSAVEALARRRGVHVVWVNPPRNDGPQPRQIR